MATKDPDTRFKTTNPIKNWVFEVVPKHGSTVTRTERIDQMEELADRLAASKSIYTAEVFEYADESRSKHTRMVYEAEYQNEITNDERESLISTFDDLVTKWVYSPTAIEDELEAYKAELQTVREE